MGRRLLILVVITAWTFLPVSETVDYVPLPEAAQALTGAARPAPAIPSLVESSFVATLSGAINASVRGKVYSRMEGLILGADGQELAIKFSFGMQDVAISSREQLTLPLGPRAEHQASIEYYSPNSTNERVYEVTEGQVVLSTATMQRIEGSFEFTATRVNEAGNRVSPAQTVQARGSFQRQEPSGGP